MAVGKAEAPVLEKTDYFHKQSVKSLIVKDSTQVSYLHRQDNQNIKP